MMGQQESNITRPIRKKIVSDRNKLESSEKHLEQNTLSAFTNKHVQATSGAVTGVLAYY